MDVGSGGGGEISGAGPCPKITYFLCASRAADDFTIIRFRFEGCDLPASARKRTGNFPQRYSPRQGCLSPFGSSVLGLLHQGVEHRRAAHIEIIPRQEISFIFGLDLRFIDHVMGLTLKGSITEVNREFEEKESELLRSR